MGMFRLFGSNGAPVRKLSVAIGAAVVLGLVAAACGGGGGGDADSHPRGDGYAYSNHASASGESPANGRLHLSTRRARTGKFRI